MQRASLSQGHIDWEAVRSGMQVNEHALEQSLTPTRQRIEEVYRKRAVQLAQIEKRTSLTAGLPVFVFRLGLESYAVELKYLSEVLPLGYCAPIPRSPAKFLGVMSVRGELRTVVDLRQVLAPSAEGPNNTGFILLLRVESGEEQIGLKVDSIEELREIRPEELTGPVAGSFVAGCASGQLTILNVDAVVASVLAKREFSREPSIK
ncbi:MAG: chemotaxis protein CheW [Acidobacteriota bacterium]